MELALEGRVSQESREVSADAAIISSLFCLCDCSTSSNFVSGCDMRDSSMS